MAQPSGYSRPQGLTYAVDEVPPPLRLLLLGLQFAVMIAMYLVLVAIILRHTDLSDSERVNVLGIAAAAAAVGTALQAVGRGPVGSGFLAPPVYSATYLAPSIIAARQGGMPLVVGMTVFAGFVEVAMGLALARLRFIVTPVLSGLTVFIVGLQLGVVGIGEMLDVDHEHLPAFHEHLAVTILTLAVCVGLSIWGRGTAKLLCSLVGLLAGMAAASAVGLFDPRAVDALNDAAWVAVPHPALLQFKFNVALMPAFLAAGIAASLRAVGVVTTCQRMNNANWRRPDMVNIRKGILADGLANVFGGILGAPGMNIAPSLVGISSVTGATSRVIAYAAAALLLCAALSPKLIAFMLVVPSEVAGSLLVFTASFMISGGMAIMLTRPADSRAVYVIGVSTLLTLSENVFPGYFQALSPAWRSVTDSPLAFGLTVAILLTLVFRLGTSLRAETSWRPTADGIEDAVAFVRRQAKSWKISADATEVCATDIRETLGYIRDARGEGQSGKLHLSTDGQELIARLMFAGEGTVKMPGVRLPATQPEDAGANEEAAVVAGLQSFLQGLAADRKYLRSRRGAITLHFIYGV